MKTLDFKKINKIMLMELEIHSILAKEKCHIVDLDHWQLKTNLKEKSQAERWFRKISLK